MSSESAKQFAYECDAEAAIERNIMVAVRKVSAAMAERAVARERKIFEQVLAKHDLTRNHP